VLEEDNEIFASGAMSGPVLKCVAVDKSHESEGFIGKIVTYLLLKAHHEGINHLFLYTSPKNVLIFSKLGFVEIARVNDTAVLMDIGASLSDRKSRIGKQSCPCFYTR
jgi:[citrate (pro-3S)-lyase] ligase